MNGKQRVKAAIHFNGPDQMPVWFDEMGHSDITNCTICMIGASDSPDSYAEDEWGCGWTKTEVDNMGLITKEPISSWDDYLSYQLPDPHDPAIYQRLGQALEHKGDHYFLASTFLFIFERFHCLRGFENTMMDFYLEPENTSDLLDRLTEYFIQLVQGMAHHFPGQIDGVKFSDDWGSETSLFISQEMWDELFKPRYKRVFDECHQLGLDVWLHSCGKVNSILESLVEIGTDVVNFQQPGLLGIEEVGEKYAEKLCFLSLCDIQKTLPFASEQEMEQEASRLVRYWGTERGGFILGDYMDSGAIGVSREQKEKMYRAFLSQDRWKAGKQ